MFDTADRDRFRAGDHYNSLLDADGKFGAFVFDGPPMQYLCGLTILNARN